MVKKNDPPKTRKVPNQWRPVKTLPNQKIEIRRDRNFLSVTTNVTDKESSFEFN